MPLRDRIFILSGEKDFRDLAMDIFHYQASGNPLYCRYLRLLGKPPAEVNSPEEIPFLPVEFFRQHRVITGKGREELLFESSGTTSGRPARHYVREGGLYRESFTHGFELFYGKPSRYCILALLPSNLEREHSSLVYMAAELIRQSGHPKSGFYMDDQSKLGR